MVKAVAHDKGMEHHSHRSLLFAAQDIEKNIGGVRQPSSHSPNNCTGIFTRIRWTGPV
jgi:hypothetical protein